MRRYEEMRCEESWGEEGRGKKMRGRCRQRWEGWGEEKLG